MHPGRGAGAVNARCGFPVPEVDGGKIPYKSPNKARKSRKETIFIMNIRIRWQSQASHEQASGRELYKTFPNAHMHPGCRCITFSIRHGAFMDKSITLPAAKHVFPGSGI